MSIDVNAKQLLNVPTPIVLTELPIVTDVSPEFWNAYSPILVTESGIVTDVNAEQPENAESPILVTILPIVTLDKVVGLGTVLLGVEVIVAV